MALKFGSPDMPITSELTNELDLQGRKVIIIQHGVRDAVDFGLMLNKNSGGDILFLPKPFSQNDEALKYGEDNGLNIENPGLNYTDGLEKKGYLQGILNNTSGKLPLIIEVGGCFSRVIKDEEITSDKIKGVVEVTTFGHNRHINFGTNINIPTYSIERSPIKEREAKHVGLSIYRSIDHVLHELNRGLIDCNIMVVGYGMIGRNVSNAFKGCKNVRVYDNKIEEALVAQNDGFESSCSYINNILDSDIVIASTGGRSIDRDFILSCKSGTLLVSGGSRQNEIDVEFLEENTEVTVNNIHKYIKKYVIEGKDIFLFRDGKNANFASKSCPSYSIDLIHAEVIVCMKNILDGNYIIGEKYPNETTNKERKKLLELHSDYWK